MSFPINTHFLSGLSEKFKLSEAATTNQFVYRQECPLNSFTVFLVYKQCKINTFLSRQTYFRNTVLQFAFMFDFFTLEIAQASKFKVNSLDALTALHIFHLPTMEFYS